MSDFFLVGDVLKAGGKLSWNVAFKLAGSNEWKATRSWMVKNGYKELVGKEGHHWLFEQNQGLGKTVPKWLKNQPWNIKALEEGSHDLAHYGNPLQKLWYGTPDWLKRFGFSYGGRGAERVEKMIVNQPHRED